MKIAIAGLGVVGGGVIKTLQDNALEIGQCSRQPIEVVAVASLAKPADLNLGNAQFFTDPLKLVETDAEVIIELMGGADGVALELARKTLAAKKHFVTANKAMLAHHGGELAELAEKNKVSLSYEAAVAGGIPVIKTIREGLTANKIKKVMGILNGTSNYILTNMTERGIEFPEILKEAQAKGYAEKDPTFDVGGIDASHKLALLAANAFGKRPNFKDLHIEGIDKIKVKDIKYANRLGYAIKHICFAQVHDAEVVEQRAHACLVPHGHQLAGVNDVLNAIDFESQPLGQTVLIGRGAGAGPTASAVIADVIDIANGRYTYPFTVPFASLGKMKVKKIDDIESSYYLRLVVNDQPGVLEEITNVLKRWSISVKKLLQDDEDEETADVIIITHNTREATIKHAIEKFATFTSLVEPVQMIRVL
jgi:homoserine dehydrogenase